MTAASPKKPPAFAQLWPGLITISTARAPPHAVACDASGCSTSRTMTAAATSHLHASARTVIATIAGGSSAWATFR